MSARWLLWTIPLLLSLPRAAEAQSDWRTRVTPDEKARTNPLAGQPAAAAAGREIYTHNCSKCHADNLDGKNGRPGLRTDRVAGETDGELFWILIHGARWHGMPAWAGLGDEKLWQLVTYLRSERPQAETTAPAR